MCRTKEQKVALLKFRLGEFTESNVIKNKNQIPKDKNKLNNIWVKEVKMSWMGSTSTDISFNLGHDIPWNKLIQSEKVVKALDFHCAFVDYDLMQCAGRETICALIGFLPKGKEIPLETGFGL